MVLVVLVAAQMLGQAAQAGLVGLDQHTLRLVEMVLLETLAATEITAAAVVDLVVDLVAQPEQR